MEKNNETLSILRHSTSHIMAQAVQSLFPSAKLAIGPATAEGFYYDFDLTMVQALPQLWKFFQSIEGKCKSKGLYPSGNGLFSKEELDGVYASKNISDVRMAQTILQPVILLYLRGYKNG